MRGAVPAAHIRGVNSTEKNTLPPKRRRWGAAALALTLSLPVMAAAPAPFPQPPAPAIKAVSFRSLTDTPQLLVTVAPDAHVSFERQAVSSFHDPELKLDIALRTLGTAKASGTAGVLSDPLPQVRRTSSFGHRTSPITGDPAEFHSGQDFGAPCGTGVTAAAEGTVTFAEWHPYGGGNRVEITHRDGLVTTYNHLESSSVKRGQILDRGAVLGKLGTTGASTGCHLHFEVVLKGKHVDPLAWL